MVTNKEWVIEDYTEDVSSWAEITPTSGVGTTEVKVKMLQPGTELENRFAQVGFRIDRVHCAMLILTQKSSLDITLSVDKVVFSNKGKMYRILVDNIPVGTNVSKGVRLSTLINMEPGEKVVAVTSLYRKTTAQYVVFITKQGLIKKTKLLEFASIRKSGKIAINLNEGDELISVQVSSGDDEILAASYEGKCIRFSEKDVRPMGRDAAGVRGIMLTGDDVVIGAEKVEEGKTLLTVTENGFGKRTELPEYLRTGPNGEKMPQSRGGKGLKNYNITPKTGKVAGCRVVSETDDIMLIENGGVIIRVPASSVNVYKRDVQGVIIMRVEEGNKLVSVERVEAITEEGAEA